MERFLKTSELIFIERKNIYISGLAGSGKSYLLRQLYDEAVNRKINCVLTSTTGVSAFNIGGCTIHSFFNLVLPTQLPTNIEEFISRIVTKIKFKKYLLKKWTDLQILFIDEVSMLGANYIDILDNICKRIRHNNKPFGGIQLVCSGDLLQLCPVNDFFCFETPVWEEINFTNIILTKAYRFDSQQWNSILQRARIGSLTKDDISTLRKCLTKQNNSDIQPTVIYSLKRDVDDLNQVALEDMNEQPFIFEGEDVIGLEEKTTDNFVIVRHCTEEQSKILDSNLNVKRSVTLKKGAQVMLVANLDVSMGLVNGSRGVITQIEEDKVIVKFKGKQHEFEEEIVPYDFKIEHQGELLVRKIIPLILGYASTIHKCQGLSLDCAIVNCGDSIFSPAQAYVALSRVRSLEGLFLEQLRVDKIFPNKRALEYDNKMKKTGIFIDEI